MTRGEIKQAVAEAISELINPPFGWITRQQAADYLEVSLSNIDNICKVGRITNDGLKVVPKKKKGLIKFSDIQLLKS
jgi:hypothetical protein